MGPHHRKYGYQPGNRMCVVGYTYTKTTQSDLILIHYTIHTYTLYHILYYIVYTIHYTLYTIHYTIHLSLILIP